MSLTKVLHLFLKVRIDKKLKKSQFCVAGEGKSTANVFLDNMGDVIISDVVGLTVVLQKFWDIKKWGFVTVRLFFYFCSSRTCYCHLFAFYFSKIDDFLLNHHLAFYSIDMKCAMHPHFHNFKHIGEENFLKALSDLACGKKYTSLTCVPQPKTMQRKLGFQRGMNYQKKNSTGKQKRR